MSLLLGDFGHQRAANKAVERKRLIGDIHRWFNHYLRGASKAPRRGTTAYAQTCPKGRASLGPFHARTFGQLSKRRVRSTFRKPRTLGSEGGDPTVAQALDPVAGGGDGCVATPSEYADGTARYRLRTVRRRAITLLGAPKLNARLKISGVGPGVAQIAGRLWDVAPDGNSQRLVARGLYRPSDGRNVWQLHPAAWRFDRGPFGRSRAARQRRALRSPLERELRGRGARPAREAAGALTAPGGSVAFLAPGLTDRASPGPPPGAGGVSALRRSPGERATPSRT